MRNTLAPFATIVFATWLPQLGLAAVCAPINGGPIASGYLSGTQKCSLGETIGATSSHCVDDAGIEASFTSALTEAQAGVSGGGWSTWSAPPFSEYAYPFVGWTAGSSLSITLKRSAGAVGMEIEPNALNVFAVTANFLDASGNVLATSSQNVQGNSGASLFGAVCDRPVIQSVSISVDPSALGFAIAELRSDAIRGIYAKSPPSAPAVLGLPPVGATTNH